MNEIGTWITSFVKSARLRDKQYPASIASVGQFQWSAPDGRQKLHTATGEPLRQVYIVIQKDGKQAMLTLDPENAIYYGNLIARYGREAFQPHPNDSVDPDDDICAYCGTEEGPFVSVGPGLAWCERCREPEPEEIS